MAETSSKSTVRYHWELYINGETLPPKRRKCIQSIEYSNLIDSSDLLTLNVYDPDMIFIQDDLFVEDAKIKWRAYIEGMEKEIEFDGYLVAFDPDFPDDGCPTIKMYCIDGTHLMDKKKIKKTWKNKTRAQIIKEILKKYGFTASIEKGYSFRKVKSVVQSNVTDIAFCEALAAAEPDLFYFKLVGKVGYFRRYKVADEPSHFLAYRKSPYDILNFTPQITKAKIEVVEKESKIKPEYGDEWETTTTAEESGIPAGTSSPTGGDRTSNSVYNRETGTWEPV